MKREPVKPIYVEKQHPEFIGFWHEYDKYGCLSNWYKADFEYAGKHFSSVEQFMMYHKLMTFGQYDLADQVMKTDDPAEAKKIGRTHFGNFDDTLWTRISPTIVKRGVRAKFVQHPDLMEELLSTGNAVLAECSPYDKVWGIGLAPDDERVFDIRKWNGKNKLGRILMILREEFRNWKADSSNGKMAYIEAYDLPDIPEWEMNTGMLKMMPQYHDAIDAYSATLKGSEIGFFYSHTCVLDSPQKLFGDYVKKTFAEEKGIDPATIKTINVTTSNEACAEAVDNGCVDFSLNARELYRIFLRTGGAPHRKNGSIPDSFGRPAEALISDDYDFMKRDEICITELTVGSKTVKAAVANNLGQTRELIEKCKAGEAPAQILWLRA